MELIRPEYWNGWPFPSPGDLSTLGLNPGLPHCRWISLSAEPQGKPKNTGVGAQSRQLCPTLCDPMDHGPPGSSVHGILQARVLEWVAISFSAGVGSLSLLQGIFPTQELR